MSRSSIIPDHPSIMCSNDISRINEYQTEMEDFKLFLPETKPEDDGESESGTVSRSCDTSTDDNLNSTVTAKESDTSESPMDKGNCKQSGNDELEPNTAEEKEVDSESSDDECSSAVPYKDRKPTKKWMNKESIKFQYKIVEFMKNYYKKNPRATLVRIQRAMNRQMKINWAANKLSNYISYMIRLYRNVREIMDKQKLSFEDIDEEYRKPCPFYMELHEALQLSEFYRNRTVKPERPEKMKPIKRKSSGSGSSTSVKYEADGNVAGRTIISSRIQKTRNTTSTEDKVQLKSEKSTEKKCSPSEQKLEKGGKSILTMRTYNNRLCVNPYEFNKSIAIFMKEYFKKNPNSSIIQMIRSYKTETNSPFAENTIFKYSKIMITSYRQLRCEFEKLKSCANRKKLISECCPFYDDIHEAYEYSDVYRNSDWKPASDGVRPQPRKPSAIQPTTSNASSDYDMETTDETTDCPTSPKVIETPPVEKQDCDQKQANSEEAVIVTAPLQFHGFDHKQESSNKPVEQSKATVKNLVAIDESRLSSECDHQLEMMKLEDRKEERQFQIRQQENEIMKLKMQQETDIMKLKLKIEYERVKNLKQ